MNYCTECGYGPLMMITKKTGGPTKCARCDEDYKPPTQIIPDQYCGSGVYASLDEFGIALELRTEAFAGVRAHGKHVCRIVLEPEVLVSINRFAEDVENKLKEKQNERNRTDD